MASITGVRRRALPHWALPAFGGTAKGGAVPTACFCLLSCYAVSMTVSVEIKHDGVLNLFSEMERLNLIRLNTPPKGGIAAKEPSPPALSKQFAGTLRLSDTAYETLQNSLQEGRSEWNRNIF